jgi:WD40 repeat protein
VWTIGAVIVFSSLAGLHDQVASAADVLATASTPRTDLYGDPLPAGARVRMGTVAFHSPDCVRSLAFSPDGKYLASAGLGLGVRLWDMATGRQVRTFQADFGMSCRTLACSPDGKRLACSTDFGHMFVWKVETGIREIVNPNPGKGEFWHSTPGFRSDGLAVLAFQGDGPKEPFALYEGRTRKKLFNFARERVRWDVEVDIDGKTLAAAIDKTALLFDLLTGKERRSFPVGDHPVLTLALSRDGRRLAVGDVLEEVHVFDVATSKEVRRFPGRRKNGVDRSWQMIALSSDGAILAVSDWEQFSNRLYDVAAGKELRGLACPEFTPECLAFSPDSRWMAAGGRQGLRLWHVDTGKSWHERRPGHVSGVGSLAFAPDGKLLLSAGKDSKTLAGKSYVPAGREDSAVRLWDTNSGKLLRVVAEHSTGVTRVAFSPDGRRGASAGSGMVSIFAIDTGKVLFGRQGLGRLYQDVAFSPDGTMVALTDRMGSICLCRADTGQLVRRITEEESFGIRPRLTFSPNGRWLAGNENQRLRLWEVTTGKAVSGLDRALYASRITFSPDGETLTTLDDGPSATFRPIATPGKAAEVGVYAPPEAHHSLTALAYSPDGRMLAFAGSDGSVRVWETATQQERFRFANPGGIVWSLAFSPDGRNLATGNSDTTVTLWDVAALPAPLSIPKPLSAGDVDQLWTDLADADTAKAYQAVRVLSALPSRALTLLRTCLRPVRKAHSAALKRLVDALDSAKFSEREKAKAELTRIGEAALPALHEALKAPSAEVRFRAEGLIRRLEGVERLRLRRAVEVLEHLATPQAKQLLDQSATGKPDAVLTREADMARKRLVRRSVMVDPC